MIRLVSRMAFWVGLLVVVALSLVPQDSVPSTSWGDKANHAAAYAFLAWTGRIGFPGRRASLLLAAGLLLLGAGLEAAQSVLPDRIASLYDLLANTVGILLGALLATGTNTVWLKHRHTDG